MSLMVTHANADRHAALMHDMFTDRKRVFVDWLGWDVPHANGEERDGYDDALAEYVILQHEGRHLGSVRLLRTDRPHLLSHVFPFLCEGEVPSGPEVREITRLCVSPDCPSDARRLVTRTLLTALTEYALMTGIDSFTMITDIAFLQRVIACGWRCEMLGLPQPYAGQSLAAMQAFIDVDTLSILRERGVYSSPRTFSLDTVQMAAA